MAAVIQGLFFDPPIAIARLGGSDNPQEAYAWKETASPRTIGETVIVPDWTLDVLPDGSLAPRLPASVALRDGPLVRPVCVFLEVWAMIGAAGSATSTWRAVPLTESVLRDGGATLADLSFTVDARNRKAARRAGNDALQFGTFPPVVLRGDDHREARLLAGSPPDAARPMIPRDRNVPMGRVQVIRPGTQPAAGAAPWTDRVNVETIRLRFVPAKGEFYGPPDAARPLSTGGRARIAPVRLENAFLDARAGWFGNDAQNGAPDQPSDTYDGADVSTRANGPNPSSTSRMLIARRSTFARPSRPTTALPASTCLGERSIPTNRASGSSSAIGIRLPPPAHPSSSTRAVQGSGVSTPNSLARVAR